jgi:hypothetical protein
MTRISDPDELLPPVRASVERLIAWLREDGYEPALHETYRTPERGAALVAAGKSQVKGGPSMHCYRIAADIICAKHKWGCANHRCTFFDALHAKALGLGFTRVRLTEPKTGRKYWDGPHVQAVPVAVQNQVRRAKPEEIEQLAREYLRAA